MWKKEPVLLITTVLVAILVIQKILAGEILTFETISQILALFAGGTVARSQVSPIERKGNDN